MLLVTGLLAEEPVKRYAQESKVEAEVLALNISVAALLTPERIADELKNLNLPFELMERSTIPLSESSISVSS